MSAAAKTILGPYRRWFFEAYEEITSGNPFSSTKLWQRIEENTVKSDALGTALGLFLLANHQQNFDTAELQGDRRIIKAANICAMALSDLMTIHNRCDTVELAILSSALKNINLYLKRPKIAKLTALSKNYAYQNCVQGGGLMSASERGVLSYDLLLACVPFGLFEPEDLVLVESIKTLSAPTLLETATPDERALLAWYYCDQGSYAAARNLLDKHDDSNPIGKIAINKLRSIGQIASQFISHSPLGNGNRYEPLVEERFPKLVTKDDKVIIRAQSSPLSTDEPVELVVEGTASKGEIREGFWEFTIPEMAAGSKYSYYLRFRNARDVCTPVYECEVLHIRCLERVRNISKTSDNIAITGSDFCVLLSINPKGLLMIEATTSEAHVDHAHLENQQIFQLQEYSVTITCNPFSFSVHRQGTTLVATMENGLTWLEGGDGTVYQIELALKLVPAGIYGLGERYNAINQYGNFVDQFVYNQYKDQGLRTYMPMPVFYSDIGVGMHLATHNYSWFDFGKTRDDVLILGVEDNYLSIVLLVGTINQQIGQFVGGTGNPEMLPEWALGPWMSSNNWDSEAEVRRQVDLTLLHEIPATVLVIEAWSDEATFYIFNDTTYKENNGDGALVYEDFEFPDWGRWPEPKGLVEHLHQNNLKCILWQIPVIKQVTSLTHIQKDNDEASLIKNSYGVKRADGSPYRLPEGWFKDSLLLDFTNGDASRWWFAKRQYLIDDIGVDGFKTDGGEFIFGHDLKFCDGSDGRTMRNKFPNDYVSAYYEFAQQNDGITFSRSGYTGAQSFPAHWAGDERSTWDAFKRSILAGLSSGMSGIIFWGWDLAGFSGPVPSAELYIRSTQMACFCPIMQFHAESKAEHNQDRTPWNIAERSNDDRALHVYRYFANLRMSLMPYMVREARNCVSTFTPMMRAMVLDYQGDREVIELWDQYLFGRDLLVAPVIFEGETSRKVYLPKDHWWHIFENRWLEPGTHRIHAELEDIPVFAKAGAIIPFAFSQELHLGSKMPSDVGEPAKIVLLVVGNTHNKSAYEESGDASVFVTWSGQESVHIHTTGSLNKSYAVVFTNPPKKTSINDKEVRCCELNISGIPLSCVYV